MKPLTFEQAYLLMDVYKGFDPSHHPSSLPNDMRILMQNGYVYQTEDARRFTYHTSDDGQRVVMSMLSATGER